MSLFDTLSPIAENDLLQLLMSYVEMYPQYKPVITEQRINNEPLSIIVREHPSEYSVSPLLWNMEFAFRNADQLFLPIDIPAARSADLRKLLDLAFFEGSSHFRVLTITNPYKVAALEYFKEKAAETPGRITIDEDADHIGATNQILVGPDGVFHVINSDGLGMLHAIETYIEEAKGGVIKDKTIGIIGAGGAARGIAYEFAKLTSEGAGRVAIFNRTHEKASDLAQNLAGFFPNAKVAGHPLDSLASEAAKLDVIVSSITDSDPIFATGIQASLKPGAIVVDVNYGDNSVMNKSIETCRVRKDIFFYDGSGMVVEGYRIPSKRLATLWKYAIPNVVDKTIEELFGYVPQHD